METHRQSNGFQTFLEHWGMSLIPAVVALITSQVLAFFTQLTGMTWNWCYAIAASTGAAAVCLLFFAKLPLYRQRRFYTFGVRALPGRRRPFYRWGYRCAVFSILLFAYLLLSGH